MEYQAENFDVVVVGAGHAGIEAALAAARLGCSAALFTLDLDSVANMPCNPSIGGTGKGQLVREIDALGGQMALAADAVCLQSRMLNTGKGPAVRSLRMQSDRAAYKQYMKGVIERQDGLRLIQAEISGVRFTGSGDKLRASGVVTSLGAVYGAKAVIIAAGTYLDSRIHIGPVNYEAGPDSSRSAKGLSDSLRGAGIRLQRFKTGTPSRADRRSIDFSKLEYQAGDEPPEPFSALSAPGSVRNIRACHIAYTNERTHEVIRENLKYSPLYGGVIKGIGPRYCPSIEDKVVRFADKKRHQVFVEPTGADSLEMYLQGLSSSLPEWVQMKMLRTIEGFENIHVMRTAYAIEYDCCDPTQLRATLEFKDYPGLYGAGQFNGTSGYEEAAAQGLVAGINAARRIQGKSEIILPRAESYTATLIDDIVTKGVSDPYRMMTSRCENRLAVRQDNADLRMAEVSDEIGLAGEVRTAARERKKAETAAEIARLHSTSACGSPELNAYLESRGYPPLPGGIRLAELLKRPPVTYEDLARFDPGRPQISPDAAREAEIEIKYEGYIKIQTHRIEQFSKEQRRRLPPDADYSKISGLRIEAREKLNRIKPADLGQAAGISGVSPADIGVLSVWLEANGGKR